MDESTRLEPLVKYEAVFEMGIKILKTVSGLYAKRCIEWHNLEGNEMKLLNVPDYLVLDTIIFR